MQTRESAGPTLSSQAYRGLREAIVCGDLRPNERIVETEIAERFSVSRTPIREALQRLANEGSVETRRHGWVVREHTADEIKDIYETRAALEGFAVRLAVERADDEALAAIEGTLALPGRDPRAPRAQLVETNSAFHDAAIAAAGNARLSELAMLNRDYYFNYRIARAYSDEEALDSLGGHDLVFRALVDRDADRAERAMRQHILDALELIVGKI